MIFEVIINLLFLLMIGRLKYSIMAVSTRSKRTLVSKTVISEVKVLDKADVVKKTVKKLLLRRRL